MAVHADILSMKLGDFKEVPPLPPGTYAATITSIPKIDRFGQKQSLGAEFSFKLTQPMDDVDAGALAEAGGLPDDPLTYTFWLTPKAGIIIQRFLIDVLGIEPGGSIPDACAQVVGLSCLVTVENKPNRKDPKRSFSQINGFAKYE